MTRAELNDTPADAVFAEDSSDLRAYSLRRHLLAVARGMTLSIAAPFARRWGRKARQQPHVRFAYYHYVFPNQARLFEDQLRYFADSYRIVPYSEAVRRIASRSIDDHYLAISFDDGFENNARVAAPVMDRLGVQAMFFVVTDLMTFGADSIQPLVTFSRSRFDHRPLRNMTFDDLRALLRSGHEVGSHTVSHRRLSRLPDEDVRFEVGESKRILEDRLATSVPHFSFPYGTAADFSEAGARAVREAGYASCASAIRGANNAASDVYALRRDHVEAQWPTAHLEYFLSVNFDWPDQPALRAAK
jgi:peptidoglycan/xylan/chitin deacetylase (PgdA/CDA1 family)